MRAPKVSFIVPAYNAESFITQALHAMQSQTVDDIEILVMDDGSSDRTYEIASDIASKDKRVKVFTQKNQGVGATRNNLLDVAKGDFVTFVDADDIIHPAYTKILLSAAETLKTKIVFMAKPAKFAETSEPIFRDLTMNEAALIEVDHMIEGSMRGKNNISLNAGGKLIDKNAIGKSRFNEGIFYAEDILFFTKLLTHQQKIAIIGGTYYGYRDNSSGAMKSAYRPERRTGIDAFGVILDDSYFEGKDSVVKAIKARRFSELVTIAMMIRKNLFPQDYAWIKKVFLKERAGILSDSKARISYRIYALLSYFWYDMAIFIARMIRSIK